MAAISNIGLQARLLFSVFSVVIITILIITVFSLSIEQARLQNTEIQRIYYQTDALAKRLGHLVYSSNLRSAMLALVNTMQSDPAILFFRVTDTNQQNLISDNGTISPELPEDRVTMLDTDPVRVIDHTAGGTDKQFRVYLSVLNRDIYFNGTLRGKNQDQIFDTLWDITYIGQKLGTLRVGFSRQKLKADLSFHFWTILGTGISVLLVTMCIIFIVIRQSIRPLEKLVQDISGLKNSAHGESLKNQLDRIDWEADHETVQEIRRLKEAFVRIRELFDENLDQLEAHRNNLEQMVEERTMELNAINEKLKRQMVERKEIENRLVTAQKLESVGTLAGGVAHEFNNLFMAISGYAALIQRAVEPDDPVHEKAVKIRKLVGDGSESIKQLLGFARSGKYSPARLDLNEVVTANIPVFSHNRKDIDIITRYEPDIRRVFADRSQMNHVIMNLFLNASEAMAGPGILTIETENVQLSDAPVGPDKTVSGPFVRLSVSDTGHGMEKEVLDRIFDPFFTTKDLGVGTGLGLASVYGIIENHNGFITADSTPGTGSVFNVFLPAAEADE